jgi:hypothetical protein
MSCAALILLFHSKSLFDERLITLHGFFDSQAVLFAVTIQTDFADISGGRFASIYGFESFASFRIVALYFDMVHLGLSEIYVSILENVVTSFDLSITEKMVPGRCSVGVEEVLVLFDGLFGMPTPSLVSTIAELYQDLTYRKSLSPSERIR